MERRLAPLTPRMSPNERPILQVEPLSPGDVGEVVAIEPAAKITEAQLYEELARPWARVWIARPIADVPESAGRAPIAAFLLAWHVADELHVLNVATRADFRRRGAGGALVSHAIAFAQQNRVRHVLLEVRRSNAAAIGLYRSVGFFALGVRARYYPDDQDAIDMMLRLDPASGAVVWQADEVRLEP